MEMGYTLHATMTDEPGAMVRLALLLNQRGIQPEALSVGRLGDRRLLAVIRVSGDKSRAGWAARQLTRMRALEHVRVLEDDHLRHWTLLEIPVARLAEAPSNLDVVERTGTYALAEFLGHPEEAAELAERLGGRVVGGILCPSPAAVAASEPASRGTRTGQKGRILSGRTHVVRRRRGYRMAQ